MTHPLWRQSGCQIAQSAATERHVDAIRQEHDEDVRFDALHILVKNGPQPEVGVRGHLKDMTVSRYARKLRHLASVARRVARSSKGGYFQVAGPGKLPDGGSMATLAVKARSRVPATARLEARIPHDFKKTLEQAAAVTGHPTVTSFVLFALQASARKVIEEHQQAKLSAEESTRFVKALLAPTAPNAALRRAFKRYREASA